MITFVRAKFNRTPKALAECINRLGGEAITSREPDNARSGIVVNWGTMNLLPEGTLNRRIIRSKVQQSELLQYAGVSTPPLRPLTPARRVVGVFPCLARKDFKHGGRGIFPCSDVQAITDALSRGCDYVVDLIPKAAEFRVHVVRDKVLSVTRKKPENPEALVWSWTGGAVQHEFKVKVLNKVLRPIAVAAVKAVGYDFGAVDMIMSTTGMIYVLEINSAPGLQVEARLEAYAKAFMDLEA